MDFLEIGLTIGACLYSYAKGQKDGQEKIMQQLQNHQLKSELEMVKRQLQDIKNNLPPNT